LADAISAAQHQRASTLALSLALALLAAGLVLQLWHGLAAKKLPAQPATADDASGFESQSKDESPAAGAGPETGRLMHRLRVGELPAASLAQPRTHADAGAAAAPISPRQRP
jgi:hypothetical protein